NDRMRLLRKQFEEALLLRHECVKPTQHERPRFCWGVANTRDNAWERDSETKLREYLSVAQAAGTGGCPCASAPPAVRSGEDAWPWRRPVPHPSISALRVPKHTRESPGRARVRAALSPSP